MSSRRRLGKGAEVRSVRASILLTLLGASTIAPIGARANHLVEFNKARVGAYADDARNHPAQDGYYGPFPVSKNASATSGGAVGRANMDADAVFVGGILRSSSVTASASGSSPSTGGGGSGIVGVGYAGWNPGSVPIPFTLSVSVQMSSDLDAQAGGEIVVSGDSVWIRNFYHACTYDRRHWSFDLCGDDPVGSTDGDVIEVSGLIEPGRSLIVEAAVWAGASTQGRAGAEYVGSAEASLQASITIGAPIGGHFDWSVPDRYGIDADEDGLVDSYEPDGTLDPTPDGFRVDFTDGDPSHCNTAVTRHWIIDGLEVVPGDPRIIAYQPTSCEFSYLFADEGSHRVSLEIRSGGAQIDRVTEDVLLQDWVIVSLGDSVASGEGNPEIPGPVNPGWQNRQCHRSALAGPAQAARMLELLDPQTSVTFVHLACSGATIDTGMLGTYVGQEPGVPLPPQVVALEELLGDREIDALTVSIGANDVQFSDLVTTCFLHGDAPLTEECQVPGHTGSAKDAFESRLPGLAPRYDELGATLAASPIDTARDRVYITEYFDPTRDDQGEFCDQEMLEETVPLTILGISGAEAEWAGTEMMPALNGAVQAARARNGWNYVGGILSRFQNHGYCADGRWVVQLSESLQRQGWKDGTLHPNIPGHELYGDRIYEALRADLYAGGSLSAPRPPA